MSRVSLRGFAQLGVLMTLIQSFLSAFSGDSRASDKTRQTQRIRLD